MPLPGEASHHKMVPEFRLQELAAITKNQVAPRKAAVMALFYPDKQNQTHLLFILRKTYKGVHSNQVAFPGGKAEPEDNSLQATALRETFEEVGVPEKEVRVLKKLTSVFIPPSNFIVQPYIGVYDAKLPFVLQVSEVEDILEVALADILSETNTVIKKLSTSYATNVAVPAYELNGYTVWGATAMMLSEINALLKQVV